MTPLLACAGHTQAAASSWALGAVLGASVLAVAASSYVLVSRGDGS